MTTLQLVDKIAAMKTGRAFPSYIDYVRFPRFRNLEPGARIDFTFPLTVFVGQNGCGKSSALQALYGCPKGKSVGSYWFNTVIDPIEEMAAENRHCLIYSYDGGGRDREVLKTRINKAGQPDLWDTSEPIVAYGMRIGNRHPPIEKEVVYLNFRVVQNAFERAFHAERPPASGIQDLLRGRSVNLKAAFKSGRKGALGHFIHRAHEDVYQLSPQELQDVSNILGREYTAAKVLRHRYFGHWGHSVILKTRNASYSEAFAGSGETAVVVLVREVHAAPSNSLLLFDEPETSLHPGAQRLVLDFLLHKCVSSKHQIIISTHAPGFVDSLPPSAVKIFQPTQAGNFRIIQDVRPEEAFFFIGQPLTNKRTVIVEDRLAKNMVEACLDHMGPAVRNLFDVRYYPGGASAMKKDAVIYSRMEPSEIYLLFDGDQKPVGEIFNPDNLTLAQDANPVQAVLFLNEAIRNAFDIEPVFASDGGVQGGNQVQQRDLRKAYLRYMRRNAVFFPMASLEEVIWDQSAAETFLRTILPVAQSQAIVTRLLGEPSHKKKFVLFSDAICGGSSAGDLDVFHAMLIKRWVTLAPGSFTATIALLKALKSPR
ncbi:MAG: AAA family ATPase [Verrucomicrobiota bacterium]